MLILQKVLKITGHSASMQKSYNEGEKNMRKRILATALAGVMAASMSMTAFAETAGEAIPVPDGTDV